MCCLLFGSLWQLKVPLVYFINGQKGGLHCSPLYVYQNSLQCCITSSVQCTHKQAVMCVRILRMYPHVLQTTQILWSDNGLKNQNNPLLTRMNIHDYTLLWFCSCFFYFLFKWLTHPSVSVKEHGKCYIRDILNKISCSDIS